MTTKTLEDARRKLAAATAHYNQMAEKVKAEERKADTRKKIILGGALLALMKEHPGTFDRLRPLLGKHVSQRDRVWLQEMGITFTD